jgi:hypothetical protein
MKALIAAVLLTFSTVSFADDAWTHFGNPFTVTEAPIASVEFLKDPAKYNGTTVMVEGRVADVCQKAGCWLVLAEGDKSIRIRTKGHGFLVAKDGTGKTAKIEGVVKSHKVDAERVAHYESESVNKEIIPEKQAGTEIVYELIATGVAFKK